MSQTAKISSNNTVILSNSDGSTSVWLYKTEVIRRYADRVIFRTGGYFTRTTQTRINQACNQWGLPFRVSFARGKEGVYRNGEPVAPFVGGVAEVKL